MRTIPVVYEDEWLMAIDKPAGLLTIPTPKNEKNTLTNILNEELKLKNISYRLHLAHRLDRDTSGLIIYTKGKSIQKKLMEQFKARQVTKRYIAFVQGQLKEDRGEINKPIEGFKAQTRYRVIKRKKDFNVVEAIPVTGRTNQIRIHFKSLGHPIVGEDKFAFRKDFKLRFKRLCLHAAHLEFTHPVTGKIITIDSCLPESLKSFLEVSPDFT